MTVQPALPTLAFASDHAGVELRAHLRAQAEAWGYATVDLGPDAGQSVDYPDYAGKLAEALNSGPATLGVLICGSFVTAGDARTLLTEHMAADLAKPKAERVNPPVVSAEDADDAGKSADTADTDGKPETDDVINEILNAGEEGLKFTIDARTSGNTDKPAGNASGTSNA